MMSHHNREIVNDHYFINIENIGLRICLHIWLTVSRLFFVAVLLKEQQECFSVSKMKKKNSN